MNQAPVPRRSSRARPGPPPRDDELVAGRRVHSLADRSRHSTTQDSSDEDIVGKFCLLSTEQHS